MLAIKIKDLNFIFKRERKYFLQDNRVNKSIYSEAK